MFPGDELPMIETIGVDQQRLYLRQNNLLAEYVDRLEVFGFNILKNSGNHFFFFVRQVQGFVDSI